MYNPIGSLTHVTKSFGEVVAVSDASFSIEKNKIIGFLGPNGAGKTTSIQMLLGLLRPQGGDVKLFGVDPFGNAKFKHLIGYISEEGVFPKWLKARNYLINLGRYHLPRAEAIQRADEVLEEVDLVEVADKQIRKFSKGMRQRMKIAQALLHKPALVIADEPFNGLDPLIRRNMFDLVQKYKHEFGTTFFVSSHILFEVERLADQVILLYKGRTIAQGSPSRIREMIQDQPHTIQIQSPQTKELSHLLLDHSDIQTVSTIHFAEDGTSPKLLIETTNSKEFYQLITDLVVDHQLQLDEIRPVDEGLEQLFKSLTVG